MNPLITYNPHILISPNNKNLKETQITAPIIINGANEKNTLTELIPITFGQ